MGSEGRPQITYRVWKQALNKQGIPEIKTTMNQLRAQAFINKCAYNEAQYKKLWVMYQIYNGGGLVNREVKKAGKVDWQAARNQCKRKIVHFKDGSTENACSINYSYSKQVYKYGQQYGTIESTKYPFW